MKAVPAIIALFLAIQSSAQFYYKDIVGNRETAQTMKAYLNSKVTRVILTSFDENNAKIKDFHVEQKFAPVQGVLNTVSRSEMGHESIMISHINAEGQVTKTIDSSAIVITTTTYHYDASGKLVSSVSASSDSSKKTAQREIHIWQYNGNQVSRLLRIKNERDTTYVNFKFDEQGNVVEEQETRRGVKGEPFLYYYNSQNQLTDIVRYNKKAGRLLPEYMFEYDASGRVVQKITVPSGSDKYLIWRYMYNPQGLKVKEAVYNKQKQMAGKIEYQYFF